MITTAHAISVARLKRAIEGREAKVLAGFYADNAVLQIINRDHPPSAPRRLEGKPAIAAYYDDICGRAMTHRIESGIADGTHLAFTQSCAYPDGKRVFSSAMLDLDGAKIVRQTMVQAWDG